MKQSQLFTKARREDPKDEQAKNARLLIRGGFIAKEIAGAYNLLPLGLRVLKKIEKIVREEMDAVGGQELLMTSLQNPELWEKTNRWSDEVVDNWFKTSLKNDTKLGLGFTHEEPITSIVSSYVKSYRDLPFAAYQIHTKFRNEARAKSGIMRGREFLMKDLYSFHTSSEDLDTYYEKVTQAYKNIFNRLGLGERTYLTFASGGTFSKFSHEFQTLSEAGEDIIYLDEEKKIAVNKEVYTDEILAELGLDKGQLKEVKASEVGNIFKLGTRFSEPLELFYTDEQGEKKPVIMGCYGLGITRLLGVITEVLGDDKGNVWPKSVAPFLVHLLPLGGGEVAEAAQELYDRLSERGIEVLLNDRDESAGEKFFDADLLGLPYRVVISEKTLKEGKLEVKERSSGEVKMLSKEEFLNLVTEECND